MSRVLEHALGWHAEDLSDFRFELQIRGAPFVLKNSKKPVVKAIGLATGGRGRCCPRCRARLKVIPGLLPSTKSEAYRKDAVGQLQAQWGPLFRGPIPEGVLVNAAIRTYRATARKADADNLLAMPGDALEAAGVLTNDYQIGSHDGSRRLLDRSNPRVEITLTPYRE